MSLDLRRIVVGGVVGTGAMTMVGLWAAPMMGLAPMNPAEMLAGAMGGMVVAGWAAHLMIGIVLAFGYALTAPWLPGPAIARGAVFSLAPWLMAQLAVMPMMGMPVFSGSAMMALGSLIGHVVYGALVGAIVGVPAAAPGFRAVRRSA